MSDISTDSTPLISAWVRPRQIIEHLAAERPRYLVWPLAFVGGAASTANMLAGYGAGNDIAGLVALLICAAGGLVFAAFNLYVLAVLTGWIGRKMGGAATNDAVRAAIAWGSLPSILGLMLLLFFAVGGRVIVPGGDSKTLSSLLNIIGGVCGLWSLVMTLLMLSRVERFGFWRTIITYILGTTLLSFGLALTVRTFLFQPFNVPAASMAPTLVPGDYFFVSKYAYGYSHFSLPLSPPLFPGRIFGSEPMRGDVIVFRLPRDNATDFVKRVVGLPGERIQIKAGELHINGEKVQRERLPDASIDGLCGEQPRAKRWREILPNGSNYETFDCVDNGFYDNTAVYTVPAGHLFVLGDNRDNSSDSRVLSAVGYIPLENVIGRVGMIFFSRGDGRGGVPPSIRYERIGTMVK